MNAPLRVVIVADGDDALRLYKRVGCAARALGVELRIREEKAGGATPRVFVDDALLIEGLQRTEVIEARLRQHQSRFHKETPMHHPVRVLFVCDGGSARATMAAGLLRALGGERFEVHAAGIEPETISPHAVAALRDIGIDIAGQQPHALNDFEDIQFDYAISLCDEAKSACLSFPRDAHNLHWTCPDPGATPDATARAAAYAEARDELRRHIERWLPSVATDR